MPHNTANAQTLDVLPATPDMHLDAKQIFGFDVPFEVRGFADRTAYTPTVDEAYRFDKKTTIALLAGFMHNRKVMVQGYHGTGKSSHIEQVAARLNWPCIRINLDSHISRIDLIGKDAITLREGKQVTEFVEGLLPWSLQRPVALVFDEYDAGRPDVMFVIQRVLEAEGKLTLLDQNRIIGAHPSFRLFATANTIGLGDASGLYHGTQQINQGQMDRWNMVVALNYLPKEHELDIVAARVPTLDTDKGRTLITQMITLAALVRKGFMHGDISTTMSPRTVISWAENYQIFGQTQGGLEEAFRLSFYHKCDESERPLIAEYYQRVFDVELEPTTAPTQKAQAML